MWKIGLDKANFVFSPRAIFSWDFAMIIFSPAIIIGFLSYGLATILYMVLLSKFEYTNLQAVVVSSSLLFTFIAASLLFGEKISAVNIFGLLLLLAGVIFVTKF